MTCFQVHLFAALPSVGRVTTTKTATCQELVRHWQFYVARSKSLRKVFVSVKGIYCQSDVMGEEITWLAPHSFTQKMPKDVDFRVMITFLDFYEVFLRFVLFKLYTLLGLSYPPKVDPKLLDGGSYLLAIKPVRLDGGDAVEDDKNESGETIVSGKGNSKSTSVTGSKLSKLESKLAHLAGVEDDEGDADSEDEVDITRPLSDAFGALHGADYGHDDMDEADAKVFQSDDNVSAVTSGDDSVKHPHRAEGLFKNAVFFVSREVPMELMQLCIVSFGGVVGWEGADSPYSEDDPRITHQIVDRPLQTADNFPEREYIQPQWVFDSINAQLQLPVHRYRPGAALPPHLSPFVDDEREGYVPAYREDILKLQKVSAAATSGKVSDTENHDDEEEGSDSDESDNYEEELQAEKAGVSYSTAKLKKDQDESSSDEDNSESEDDEQSSDTGLVSNVKGQRAIVYEPHADEASDCIMLCIA